MDAQLHVGVFNDLLPRFGKPEIDLFASRLHTQLGDYVSWLNPETDANQWMLSLDCSKLANTNVVPFTHCHANQGTSLHRQ